MLRARLHSWSAFAALFVALVTLLPAVAGDPPVPADVVFENEPTDPKAIKVVLVSSGPFFKAGEHEWLAGCRAFKHLLAQTPGVAPVLVRDWPTKPTTFANAKAVLFYGNGGKDNPMAKGEHVAEVQKLVDAGVGLIALHQMADFPKDFSDRARTWFGGCYEPGFSKRAHWVDTQTPAADQPVSRGVKPFKIDDGWLYQSRFADGLTGVTPLLRTSDPKKDPKKLGTGPTADIVSWTFDRPGGGRSFVFTGAHLHASLAEEGYRRFLTNGILWAAGVEVPAGGAAVELPDAVLKGVLPTPPAKK